MSIFPKHAFGLDISDASIEALEIKNKFGKPTVVAYSRREIPPGIVDNGRILNKPRLIEIIEDMLYSASPRHLKTKSVVMSIPESKTYIHVFRLPAAVSEKNLGESVQYEAEETIPLSYDQVYHDYQLINKEKDWQEILYIACPKEIIDDYREVAGRAGLDPVVFEAESTSLARALVGDDYFEGVLIVDLGARTTIITIYDHQVIRYSQNIEVAGNAFNKQIMKETKVTEQEAEKLKREIGLVGGQKKSKIGYSLEPLVKEIIKFINKGIGYYQKKTGYVVNKVMLCGGTSLMPGLVEYLREALEIKVEIGSPLSNLRFDQALFKDQPPVLFSTVVGLAKRGLNDKTINQGINLLAREEGHKKFKAIKEAAAPRAPKIKKTVQPAKKRTMILLAVFIFLALAFVGILFLQKNRTEPLIKITSVNGTASLNSNQSAAFFPLSLELAVYTQTKDNLPAGQSLGRLLEKIITKSTEFPATGKKTVDSQAAGKIRIINNSTASQPLVATTRFLTPGGVLFRLKEGTMVPAKGSVEAEIYPDQPSQKVEVKSAAHLTIPGLSASLQEYIYGETSAAIGGSSGEVAYITEADINAAKKEMEKSLIALTSADMEQEPGEGEVLLPDALLKKLDHYDISPKEGDQAEKFTLTMTVKITGLLFSADEVNNLLIEQLAKKIPAGKKTADYKLLEARYILKDFDQEKGIVTLQVESDAE